MLSNLNDMSWVAAAGNVGSALLVGPFLVLVMRRLGLSSRKMLVIGLIGWCALFSAQIVMWQWFGYRAGYDGFKYLQPWMLPVAGLNFAGSVILTRESHSGRARAGRPSS